MIGYSVLRVYIALVLLTSVTKNWIKYANETNRRVRNYRGAEGASHRANLSGKGTVGRRNSGERLNLSHRRGLYLRGLRNKAYLKIERNFPV